MAKAKGTTLIGAVRFLRSRKERARAALPPELHSYLEERVVESRWYPEADLEALLEAVCSLIPGPRGEVLGEMGAHSAREHLEGIYSHLRFDALEGVWRRAIALWASQHDTGRFDAETVAPGELRMTVRGFGHPSEALCGVLGGYFAEALRLAGATGLTVAKESCVLRGASECVWRMTHTGGVE